MTTITLEYAAPMIKEAASEDYQPIFANKGAGTSPEAEARLTAASGQGANGARENGTGPEEASPYTWTAEAQARLERAPEGFMRDCTKALIIKHADKLGTTHITLEVANEGIEQAKGYMEEAMKTGNLKDMIANLTGKASTK
jgi:hypothetical protein